MTDDATTLSEAADLLQKAAAERIGDCAVDWLFIFAAGDAPDRMAPHLVSWLRDAVDDHGVADPAAVGFARAVLGLPGEQP